MAVFPGTYGLSRDNRTSFYFVVKPYLRFEKMMRLFTDGYTTMEISDLYDVTLPRPDTACLSV